MRCPGSPRGVEAAKQRLAQMGYDDMLARLDQALHGISGERLAQTIAQQYPVALIDEFQDTDPLQWRIFQRIYAERQHTGLLLIGDPKQAIYSFRGADIHTYLHARRRADAPTWTLDTNYRSTPVAGARGQPCLRPCRAACPTARSPSARARMRCRSCRLSAHGRSERLLFDGEPLPAMQLARAWRQLEPISKKRLSRADGRTRVPRGWFRCSMRRNAASAALPSDTGGFAATGTGRHRHPRAQRHRGGQRACQALQARGLASVYLSDRDSVYDSAEAVDLLLWLHACAEPGSDRAMRAALATRDAGPALRGARSPQSRRGVLGSRWASASAAARDAGCDKACWRCCTNCCMLFDLPAQLLARDGGERILTNLLHLAELLQQAAATLDGEHALLRHLGNQIAQADDAQTETARRQDRAAGKRGSADPGDHHPQVEGPRVSAGAAALRVRDARNEARRPFRAARRRRRSPRWTCSPRTRRSCAPTTNACRKTCACSTWR